MTKKIITILTIFFISLTLASCDKNQKPPYDNGVVDLQILTLNDTHGYLEGVMPKIASYIKEQKLDESTETIVLSAGDMFQGTALSNLTRGKTMVECMNEIGFDAMSIGNHEFDWTIDEIAKFKDGNKENGEANFEFLAANIFYKGTDTNIEFTKPYTIVNTKNLKIGVIGTIGEHLTNSISASMVADYEFRDPLQIVKDSAKELRTKKDCDLVVLNTHYGDEDNFLYNNLTGDYKIDAIVNGHTHTAEVSSSAVPSVQASSNGKQVGEIVITYDTKKERVTNSSVKLKDVSSLTHKDDKVDTIIDNNLEAIRPIINQKLTTLTSNFSKSAIAVYGCKVIKKAFAVDFAFVNGGGFRTSFKRNQEIIYGDMIEMIPFDNEIKLVTLTGSQLKWCFRSNADIIADSTMDENNVADGILIEDNKEYLVAAIDYIFDKTNYPFLSGKNIEITGIKFRDVFVSDLKLTNNDWDLYRNPKIDKIEW